MTLSVAPETVIDRNAAAAANETAIEFKGVSKHFLKDEAVVPVLSDVTLSIRTGQFVALVGPSGCGKSTLLNLVSGLVRPSAGTVLYDGDPVTTVNSRVGYVTQRDNLVPWRTVVANLELPLELRGVPRPERIARARELIAQVGLSGFENHYPGELSGGMRKRVSLARAFIYGAQTLLMDEPFGALDAQLKLLIEAELMRLWQAARQTILYVTHDLHEAIVLADWVIVFSARPARPGDPADRYTAAARPDRDTVFAGVPRTARDALGIAAARAEPRRECRMTVRMIPQGDYAEIALADRTRRRSRKRQVMLIRLLLLAAILGLWQWAAGRIIDESWLSSPGEIAERLWGWMLDGTLPYNSWITLQEMGIGFLIGASTGVIAGLALGLSETVGDTLHPFVLAVYSLPKVAMGPLFILWFGIDMQMKIALSAITVFFLVFWNAYAGVRQSDQELIDTVRMMGASRLQLIVKIIVPGTLAWIYTGLKLSVPYALIGAIVGEIIASNRGLGYLISYSAGNFDTAGVIGALLVLMGISVVLNTIIGHSERRAFRWQTTRES